MFFMLWSQYSLAGFDAKIKTYKENELIQS